MEDLLSDDWGAKNFPVYNKVPGKFKQKGPKSLFTWGAFFPKLAKTRWGTFPKGQKRSV